MSDAQHEVFKHLREGQDKYTYFLLTAAGGAVALAVNQTHAEVLKWSQLPLATAVLCGGVSFFSGCAKIEYVNSVLYANLDLITVERGIHPKAGSDPQMIEAASAGIRDAIEANSTKSSFRLADCRAGSSLRVPCSTLPGTYWKCGFGPGTTDLG